ncbi:hypothetical protein V5799_027459 [Amblyomma americanum]|uniref:Uncharacterized protein n=1 Tax=Amblyomma americanum TaxID=6943 RepID=A0AAQ4DFP0_AMBAM
MSCSVRTAKDPRRADTAPGEDQDPTPAAGTRLRTVATGGAGADPRPSHHFKKEEEDREEQLPVGQEKKLTYRGCVQRIRELQLLLNDLTGEQFVRRYLMLDVRTSYTNPDTDVKVLAAVLSALST